jgi:molybdopterin/thiamine biosynthesis adenylyltransferase
MSDFTEEQIHRYSRHILLPEIGGAGQHKINNAKVLIIGTGGLGSPVSFYLTAAGVGTIGLVDDDAVELSNLQRQIVHSTPDISRPKVISAQEKLKALNPNVEIIPYQTRFTADNALDLIEGYDIIVDATDYFNTRYLINDACIAQKKPFIYGGVLRFVGQVLTIIPGQGPCFRCIFPEMPDSDAVPSCGEAGVLGAIAGTIGTIQATEVLKYIIGKGQLLCGHMAVYDALSVTLRKVAFQRDPLCPSCSNETPVFGLNKNDTCRTCK